MNPTPLITTTEAVDKAFYIIFGISALSLLGITLAMLYLLWRYNRKRQPVPLSQKDHNVWLEVTWTIIPTILVMLMFWYGWEGYLSLRRIPDNAMIVKGSARMWSWLFSYQNGKTSDRLFVPVGQPVKVELIAEDVLHSFYVPAFRVKRDCVPGMPTYAWFVAEKPGSYDLFCAEYCGVGHADMITTVEALPASDFEEWLSVLPAAEDRGPELLKKNGCLGCHSLDGSPMVGPSFAGIGGRQITVVSNGKEISRNSDTAYLERSILDPNSEIVKGYPPAMPAYAGRIAEQDLTEIVAYLASLTETAPTAPPPSAISQPKPERQSVAPPPHLPIQDNPGLELARSNGCLGCHSLDGTPRVGPTFQGLFGSQRRLTREGEEIVLNADHDYLQRAIRNPNAEIVKGYPAAMPPYPGLSDDNLELLIDWLKDLP
ncbi:MAG: cytochrome c oxidase subunit II [Desulfuromonas sp.]|nr:MAG: cytochrome c oxidase subunit II [Desulfuromonas sp.]